MPGVIHVKAIIMAAGKGTRMYPLTEKCPKALLPLVGGITFLDHLITNIQDVTEIDQIIVVVNRDYHDSFKRWNKYQNITFFVTDVENNVIECLQTVCSDLEIHDDLLIAASDNLIFFSLKYFTDYFYTQREKITVMYCIENSNSELKRTGVALVQNGYIVDMEEKPQNPKFNCAIPPFYIIPASKVDCVNQFLNVVKQVDSLGSFMSWCIKHEQVRAFQMPGKRLNLGDKQAYLNYINSERVSPSLK